MNFAVLLSGGTGTRIASDIPKQYIRAGGCMMITHTLRTLLSAKQVGAVCIVAAPARQEEIRGELPEGKPVFFAAPGANRQLSIWNGLQEIGKRRKELNGKTAAQSDGQVSAGDTVFIHDAARPFLAQTLIDACYRALPGHDGVLPVLPMKDTIYESGDGTSVARLLDRSRLFAGQAPELFVLDPYIAANEALLPDKILAINGSTEPAILAGLGVIMIPGDEANFKVTTNADLTRYLEYFGEVPS